MSPNETEFDDNAPVFSFQLREGEQVVPLVITGGDLARWTDGNFTPGDAKAVGVLAQHTLTLEQNVSATLGFQIALAAFLGTLIDQGHCPDAQKMLMTIANLQADGHRERLNAHLGPDWLANASKEVAAAARSILAPAEGKLSPDA